MKINKKDQKSKNNIKNTFILAILLVLLLCKNVLPIYAYTLNGKVVIKDTELPIRNEIINTDTQQVKSNKKGLFTIELDSQSPTQTIKEKIQITAKGYEDYNQVITVRPTQVRVSPRLFELELKTIIKASKQTVIADRGQEKISYYNLKGDTISRLSESSIFADATNSIKLLPGVASKGGLNASIYIRGGNAYELIGVLDDVPINQPYFWGRSVSIFNPIVTEQVDFYPHYLKFQN